MFEKSNLNNHEGERSKVIPLLLKQQEVLTLGWDCLKNVHRVKICH